MSVVQKTFEQFQVTFDGKPVHGEWQPAGIDMTDGELARIVHRPEEFCLGATVTRPIRPANS